MSAAFKQGKKIDLLEAISQGTGVFQPPPTVEQDHHSIELHIDSRTLPLISKSIFDSKSVQDAVGADEKVHAILTNIEMRSTELESTFPQSLQESLNHALSEMVGKVGEGADPSTLSLALSDDGKTIIFEQEKPANAVNEKKEDLFESLPANNFQPIQGTDEQVKENRKFLRNVQERGMEFMRSWGYPKEQALEANKYASTHHTRSYYPANTIDAKTNSSYREEVWDRYTLALKLYVSKNPPKQETSLKPDIERLTDKIKLLGEKQKSLFFLDGSGSVGSFWELNLEIIKTVKNLGLPIEIEVSHLNQGDYHLALNGKIFKQNTIFVITDALEEKFTQRELKDFLKKNPNLQLNFVHLKILNRLRGYEDTPKDHINEQDLRILAAETGGRYSIINHVDNPYIVDPNDVLKSVKDYLQTQESSVDGQIAKKQRKKFEAEMKSGDISSIRTSINAGYLPFGLATQAVEEGWTKALPEFISLMETTTTALVRNWRYDNSLLARWRMDISDAFLASIEKNDFKTANLIFANSSVVSYMTSEKANESLQRITFSQENSLLANFLSNPQFMQKIDMDNPGPLQGAYNSLNQEAISMLFDAGFNANARFEDGRTLLHYAAERREVGLCELLLEKGVDPNLQDMNGDTPIDLVPSGLEDLRSKMKGFSDVYKKEGRIDEYASFSQQEIDQIKETIRTDAYVQTIVDNRIYNPAEENIAMETVHSVLGATAISRYTSEFKFNTSFLELPLDRKLQVLAYSIRTPSGKPNILGLSYQVTGPNLNPAQFYKRKLGDCGDFVTMFAFLGENMGLGSKEDFILIGTTAKSSAPSPFTSPNGYTGHMTCMVHAEGQYYLADMTMDGATWISIGKKRPTDEQLGEICSKYIQLDGEKLLPGTTSTRIYHGWEEFMKASGTPMPKPVDISKK